MSTIRCSKRYFLIELPHEKFDFKRPKAERDADRAVRKENYKRLSAWRAANKVPGSGYLDKSKAEATLAKAKVDLDFPIEVQELFYLSF